MLRQQASSRSTKATVLIIASLLMACTGDEASKPALRPIPASSVAVNETLRLTLTVENPSGVSLEYSFVGPDLPGLAEVTDISGSPSGGEFRWTPLASHVGTHEISFQITSRFGTDSESVLITVTPAHSAAPIFLRPGAGGTYDLSSEPCVRFDVEVRDDDSSTVDIRLRGTPPDGARLFVEGPKQARFDWCPTSDQTASTERWTIGLEADDGDHPPTKHDYLVVLRTEARENCTGTPPVISILSPSDNARVASSTGYDVAISVTDDVGIREAPLLYYTTSAPANPASPDITSFDQTSFRESGGQWEATIPSLGLQPDQEQTIYYLVSATDNDDSSGTACDHRTDTPLHQFIATGTEQVELAEVCDVCFASLECESGVCASSGGGARCLQSCSGGLTCSSGTCQATTLVEGATTEACGDVVTVCEGGGEVCTDDANEDNDTLETASTITYGTTRATLCAADPDYYRYSVTFSTDLDVTLDEFAYEDADLDIEMLDSSGTRLGLSAGLGPEENLDYCLPAGSSIYLRVYSVSASDESDYALTLDEAVGDCCENDDDEPNDTLGTATPISGSDFEGVICPSDRDHHSFFIGGPSTVSALIIFDPAEADLDLELYDPDGALEDYSRGTTGEEEIERILCDAGVYVLLVKPYSGSTEYVGEAQVTPLPTCTTTATCPISTVCNGTSCVCDGCQTDTDCPTDHFCPAAGPDTTSSYCAAECDSDNDCRLDGDYVETCKFFPEGLGCGLEGNKLNGESCRDFEDCQGRSACLDWPGGYCARADCWTADDCEEDTFCTEVTENEWICVRKCGGVEPACRTAEGYVCRSLTDIGGTEMGGCVPE